MRAIFLMLALAGCVDVDRGAHTFALTGDVDTFREDLERAARAWTDLDFELVDVGHAPDVTITIKLDRYLAPNWGVANQRTDTVYLAPQLWDPAAKVSERGKLGIIAHEIGHVLLDCGHLQPPRTGIMLPGGGYTVTTDDRWLACETIGRCE